MEGIKQGAQMPPWTSRPSETPPPILPSQTAAPMLADIDIPHGCEAYASIIDAYAMLEQCGYTFYYKDVIGDSSLALSGGITYNTVWEKPTLMYSFYDINGDGTPELLIGTKSAYSEWVSIYGIYASRNGKPVFAVQTEHRYNLSLLEDSNGNCVIEHSWGHMGVADEFFYMLDENNELILLDKLSTDGDDIRDGEVFGSFRAKDVNGEKVNITEEEYCLLIQKYGSWGYCILEETGEARLISLDWKPILISQ